MEARAEVPDPQRPRLAPTPNLLQDPATLLVRVVEVRRDPDSAVRPPVDDVAGLDQPPAAVLAPLEVHAHGVPATARLPRGVDPQALLLGELQDQGGLAQRLLPDLLHA